MSEVQTRNKAGKLRYFSTVKEALAFAQKDLTVWKISFPLDDERVRLIRDGDSFILSQMDKLIEEVVQQYEGT